jgi:hypothetical protein
MSVATLSNILPGVPIGQPKTRWFKAPDAEDDPDNPGDFDNWPRAARRLWKILLRRIRKTGAKIILHPVWKLAELCGRGQRWVWKALAQLQELGVIRRFWCDGRKEVENRKGHHGDVGRATEIVVDLARPEPKAKAEPRAKATSKPAASQIPNLPGAIPKTTPEQQAAADRRHAETKAINAEDGQPATAEDWAEFRKRFGLGAPRSGRDPNHDSQYRTIKAEMEAQEEARRQRDRQAASPSDQLPAQPAGPGVLAPESGS